MEGSISKSHFFTQLAALTRKEINQILRDRSLIFLLFFMPILQLFLYGFALSPEVEHLRLGVVDYALSKTSHEFVSALVENGVFDIEPSGGSEKTLSQKVLQGKLEAGLVIPPQLERQLQQKSSTRVQFMLDAVDANTAGIASGYISQIMNSFNRRLLFQSQNNGSSIAPVQSVQPQISFVYNPGLTSSWFFVPGVIGLVLNLVSTLVSSAALIREKDSGTLEQLLMTPVGSFQILVAKIVPLAILLITNVAVSLTVSRFVFHVPFRGNLLLFLFVSFLFILVGISIGISLAAYAQNQRQSLLTSFFINLPVIQLSGAIAPVESMPELFQALSVFDPLKYYVICVRAIMLKGAGLEAIWSDVLALAAFATVLLTLSSSRFRKQLR